MCELKTLLYDYCFGLVRRQGEIEILRAVHKHIGAIYCPKSPGDVLFFELNRSLRDSFFPEKILKALRSRSSSCHCRRTS